jgi:hypothetical protein
MMTAIDRQTSSTSNKEVAPPLAVDIPRLESFRASAG